MQGAAVLRAVSGVGLGYSPQRVLRSAHEIKTSFLMGVAPSTQLVRAPLFVASGRLSPTEGEGETPPVIARA